MSSKFGQRYECQLPDVADVGKVQEEEKTAAETGISDLLKPMELAPCLLKVFSHIQESTHTNKTDTRPTKE